MTYRITISTLMSQPVQTTIETDDIQEAETMARAELALGDTLIIEPIRS